MEVDDIFNRLADKSKQENLEIRVEILEAEVKTLRDLILEQCEINSNFIDLIKPKNETRIN